MSIKKPLCCRVRIPPNVLLCGYLNPKYKRCQMFYA
nr:MAG TPA: hypothetical protein [Caudoviricetes sp.]